MKKFKKIIAMLLVIMMAGIVIPSGLVFAEGELPALEGTPTISGTVKVGETVSVDTSTLTPQPIDNKSWSFQWIQGNGNLIEGATKRNYTIPDNLSGKKLSCRVSSTEATGHVETQKADVLAADPGGSGENALTGTVIIEGELRVGQELTANTSGLNIQTNLSFQWMQGGGNPIEGAIKRKFTLTGAQLDKKISCQVTSTDATGSVTSAQTEKVAAANPGELGNDVLQGDVIIKGTPEVGKTLTLDLSGLNVQTNLHIQWKSGGATEIKGENGLSYVVRSEDIGKRVQVVVTSDDATGSVSGRTEHVPDPNPAPIIPTPKPEQKPETPPVTDITDITSPGENAFDAVVKVNGTTTDIIDSEENKEVADVIKKAEEAGKKVELQLQVDEMKLADIPANAKNKIEAAVEKKATENKSEIKPAAFLDINLAMFIEGDNNPDNSAFVKKLTKPVTITVSEPDSMPALATGMKRQFYIVRMHGGVADIMGPFSAVGGKISFTTDRFSTYALYYEDVAIVADNDTPNADNNNNNNNSNTNTNNNSSANNNTNSNSNSGSGSSNTSSGQASGSKSPKTGEEDASGIIYLVTMLAILGLVGQTAIRKKA